MLFFIETIFDVAVDIVNTNDLLVLILFSLIVLSFIVFHVK